MKCPPKRRIAERLVSVQAVIYFIFNEGYSATEGERLVRRELSNEAIRLGRLLCQLMPDEPENLGLLALMLLQDSRTDARVSSDGGLGHSGGAGSLEVGSSHQIQAGLELVPKALRMRVPGPYQLQSRDRRDPR